MHREPKAPRAPWWGMALAVALAAVAAVPSTAAERDSILAAAEVPPLVPALAAPRLGGYLQARSTAQAHVGLTNTLNRARFSIDGALPARFSYRFLVELEASAGARSPSTPSLREAYARWSAPPFAVTAGQIKTPFTREYLIAVPSLETARPVGRGRLARAQVRRRRGGRVRPRRTWATLSAGRRSTARAQNASANRDSTVLWVARATVGPLPMLGLGGSVTHDGPDSLRWGVDGTIEYLGVMVRADYLTRHRRGRAHERDDAGWSVLAGYRVTPSVQLIARLDQLERPWIGPARRIRGTDLGLNLELVPTRVRLMVQGIRRTTGKPRTSTDTAVAQLQVRF